jgi:hypothetical protein
MVWQPFASSSATHLLRIELIRLLIVAFGLLSRSSSMSVWSCWILSGTGTHWHTWSSRAFQTCSMADEWQVAGLRWSRSWGSRMWRSFAGVVNNGLRLWGRLHVLPNSLKQCWRRLMLTLNSLATTLVDNPAVSMPIARSLKTWDITGIILCDKTAHVWGLLLSSAQGASL